MPTRNASGTAISETVRIASAWRKWWKVVCPVDMRTSHVNSAEKPTPPTIITPAR